jgi:hypothetical protein
VPEAGHRNAIEVAQSASGGFVEQRNGVLEEELAVAAGSLKADGQIGGGVVWSEWLEHEAPRQARVQRAASTEA